MTQCFKSWGGLAFSSCYIWSWIICSVDKHTCYGMLEDKILNCAGLLVLRSFFFTHFMYAYYFVGRNYFGNTNWELLHPMVSMNERLIFKWICLCVELLKSCHFIWIHLGCYLRGLLPFVFYVIVHFSITIESPVFPWFCNLANARRVIGRCASYSGWDCKFEELVFYCQNLEA